MREVFNSMPKRKSEVRKLNTSNQNTKMRNYGSPLKEMRWSGSPPAY